MEDKKMLSPHFSASELACRCGCGLCDPDPKLIWCLERMRQILKRPIVIESGHRCAKHNEKIGGSKGSQHLLGKAADIRVTGDKERYEVLKAAFNLGFSGIAVARNFVHVDVRDSQGVTWLYG